MRAQILFHSVINTLYKAVQHKLKIDHTILIGRAVRGINLIAKEGSTSPLTAETLKPSRSNQLPSQHSSTMLKNLIIKCVRIVLLRALN
ncbi:hypothetical protein M3J09_013766 [Ascochyta lentis]